jgi:hypothetical protein
MIKTCSTHEIEEKCKTLKIGNGKRREILRHLIENK